MKKGVTVIKGREYNKVTFLLGDECEHCGADWNLETHHIFGGPNRDLSDKLGLVVKLCSRCHRTNKDSVHNDYERGLELKALGQRAFESVNSHEDFMRLFGRNYL